MLRKPPQYGPRLEALLDERDHLRVQISLAEESAKADQEQLKTRRARLRELEKEIKANWCE